MRTDIGRLHDALVDLAGFLNQPQRDRALLEEAGVSLDRALFPLLMGIARWGPIGVVELADRAGRDYTTISRQVARLERLGLVVRRVSKSDQRVRTATITARGRRMGAALERARERLAQEVLAHWSHTDFRDLVRLVRRLADDLLAWRA